MIVLASISLVCSAFIFILALLSTTIDPDKGIKGGKWVTLQPNEKRMRLIWFVIASLPSIILSAFYLIIS